MLIRLRNSVSLEDENKTLLVLGTYSKSTSARILEQDKSFRNSTICFVDDLSKVKWELQNGIFDFLYIPLNKAHLIDKRMFRFL